MRVPLVMRWPGRIRQGVVNDLTESVDVPHTILDMLDAPALPVSTAALCVPISKPERSAIRANHIFSEYLENEEAYIRTATHKFIYCTGNRKRTDGYVTDKPTPGRYLRLYDLRKDPGEFSDVAAKNPKIVAKMKTLMLDRFARPTPTLRTSRRTLLSRTSSTGICVRAMLSPMRRPDA